MAAALLWRHPRFELTAVTSRSDVGRRLDDLYPRHRVPLVMEELDLDRHADGLDAAVVAYPHHAAAPVVAALRERGVRVVDLSADFRLRDLDGLRALVRSARRRPTCSKPPSTAFRSSGTASRSSDANVVANPGCFPTAALLGLAPLARAGPAPRRRDRREDGRLRRRPRRDEETHFVTVDENVIAYKVGGAPPRARDRPGAGACSAAGGP